MNGPSTFNTLVGQIYEGATDAAAWSMIVPAIAAWIGAPKAVLLTPFLPPSEGGFVFSHAISPEFLDLWGARYHAEDIWARRAVERGLIRPANVIFDRDLVSDEEFMASRIYREFFSLQGIARLMSGIIFAENELNFPVTAISFFRGWQDRSFDTRHGQKLSQLIPHLSRAVGVMARLADAEIGTSTSVAAFERLSSGVVLLTATGQIAYANRVAQSIFASNDGLRSAIRGKEGLPRLHAEQSRANEMMNQAVELTLASRHGDASPVGKIVLVPRPSGARPYILQFCALNSNASTLLGKRRPHGIVIISGEKDDRHGLDVTQMAAIFGLTPAETRAAEALGRGGSIEQVAENLRISPNTLKSQLKAVYAKMNIDSRAELATFVAGLTKFMVPIAALF